ncbi:MAG: glycosyltransferase [Lachnospiraceae bacterium]|nr:glycosyltransferase [Lachnospiraceae bacterium]
MNHVSIIIPTYNRANVIENSIQSILNQTYHEYELLIIDDGSTDNTEDVVNSLASTSTAGNRIRYIKMPENKGVAVARNEGIRQAHYDYIAFQDSDDYWKPDKLEKQMAYFTGISSGSDSGTSTTTGLKTALLYCPYECQKQDSSTILVPDKNMPLSEKQGNIYEYMLRRNTIGTPCVILRKECIEKAGLFNENLRCLEDWEFFLRISKHYEIAFQDEPLVKVNLSTDGVSHNISGYYEARCHMLALHKNALLKYGIFEDVTNDILESAQQLGILQQVSQIMQYYLLNN